MCSRRLVLFDCKRLMFSRRLDMSSSYSSCHVAKFYCIVNIKDINDHYQIPRLLLDGPTPVEHTFQSHSMRENLAAVNELSSICDDLLMFV